MQKIIVNGANGYVASHFVKELLCQGFKVVALVRKSVGVSAAQRMKNVLGEIAPGVNLRNLRVYNYSLNEKDYSLTQKQLDTIFEGDVSFFHFAACLKFKSRDRDEIFKTNVDGVKNSVKVFLKHATHKSRFFFVSTAYSCGKISKPFKEDFYRNEEISEFRNYYEQSKRYSENELKKHIENDNLNAHILRLSQVVGNNKSGVTKTNYGIFDFIKKIQHFSNQYPNEKIRIQIDPDSTQNLIPIDNVVDYLMKLLDREEIPVVLNFVGRKSIKNTRIIKTIANLLPIEIVAEKKLKKEELNKYERMIAAGMSFTGVYANTKLEFETKNLEQTVSPNGNEITPESLDRMVTYFVGENSPDKKETKLARMNLKNNKSQISA